MKFVNLHAHTTFSIGDGLNYPDDHFNFVLQNAESESMGMAITDHGNCNSFGYALQSLSGLKKKGVNFHFIPGCEMYIHPDLDQWKKLKEEEQEEDEEGTIEIEADSKSKNKWYDPIKRRHHLVVLAQNKKGIENLNKLVSWSFEHGMYRYPRVDFKRLEQHNEGLIISTACMAGLPMWLILRDLEKGKEEVFKTLDKELKPLLDIFGPERAYLELQFNKIDEQKILNQYLIDYSQKTGYKTIATADSHYAKPEYWKSREMYKLLAYQSRKMKVSVDDLPASKDDLKCELYPKSGQEMFDAYKSYDPTLDEKIVRESIERSYHIAHDMVEKFIPDGKYKLPKLKHEKSDIETLRQLATDGLKKKGLDQNKEYTDRLERELLIIEKKNYSLYFLVLLEALNEIKKECLIGHGRGSGAGSLVCYVLGITNLDPIKWNLLFERFLSENRTEAVDIDSDVEDRELVLSILRRHFGEESIILITNYNTLQLKSLVKDISKFYDIPFDEVNKVTSVVEEEAKQSILDEVGGDQKLYSLTYDGAYKYSPTFRTFIDKYPLVNENIKILFKQNKSIGVHAGGTVITENAECHMPLIMRKPDKKSYQKQTPWSEGLTVKHLEQFGIIKYDFLGLETLKMIKNCIFNILKKQKKDPSLENMFAFYNENLLPEVLGEGEQKVFENIYHNGKFLSIFQFTEKGVCEFARKAKPTRVSDISAITALWRPGPLNGQADLKYLEAIENPHLIRYDHPILKEVLSPSRGILVYQEQFMILANKLAGFTLTEADELRKLLVKPVTSLGDEMKKKRQDVGEKFIQGCIANGLTPARANSLWFDEILGFISYGFNKSHSDCYAMLSYQCAWLFNYYPVQWAAAVLESEAASSAKPDEKARAISQVKSFGFNILFPDINKSESRWKIIDDKTIAAPFTLIKSVGDKAVPEIIKGQPYKTVEDLLFNDNLVYRLLNKRVIDVLCKSNSLDELMDSRFDNDGHFRHCVGEMRSTKQTTTAKKFNDYVLETRGQFQPITRDQKILDKQSLLGYFDVDSLISAKVKSIFEKNGYLPISSYPEYQIPEVWYVLVNHESKVSQKGNQYYLLTVIDDSYRENTIYMYDANNELLIDNSVYYGKITKYNEHFGFSIYDSKRVIKRLQ